MMVKYGCTTAPIRPHRKVLIDTFDWQWYPCNDPPTHATWCWLRYSDGRVELGSWSVNHFWSKIGAHITEPTHWCWIPEPIYGS